MSKKYKSNDNGGTSLVVMSVIWLLWVALMYYLLLPAINIHSVGLWLYLIFVCFLPGWLFCMLRRVSLNFKFRHTAYQRTGKVEYIYLSIAGGLLLVLLILGIIGSKMFHASAYSSILSVEEYNFTEDIDQSSALNKIALMDTDSAILLGNREIGGLSEVVSQYNVSADYTQIDLNGLPVKVSALNYAGFFKYMGNKDDGVPGYVKVDPVRQNADYVAFEENMYYVPSAYFAKDLHRHLRSKYPTKIFGNIHFEVDEQGKPFYVASVYKYTIGVFGGETIAGAIVCNPTDGSCEYYDVSEIPVWVDDVFDGNLLVEQYNWYGQLSNGFWNSIFGKKGCKKCTETVQVNHSSDEEEEEETYAPDYGYIAKEGDIWIYTGVTSVNDDASNIGFILVNERTSEAHYYVISGADESSAMAAAEGEVQEKGYRASFPSLVNVDGQPTYVMVLKDASGIVKLYAMVNVESYNKVTTATELEDCFAKYRKLIGTNVETEPEDLTADTNEPEEPIGEVSQTTFTIQEIQYIDIDGNTFVYLGGDDGKLYRQKFADNEQLIYLNPNDTLTVNYIEGNDSANLIVDFEVKVVNESEQVPETDENRDISSEP